MSNASVSKNREEDDFKLIDRSALNAKNAKAKADLQFGKNVSAEDVKRLGEDFADVFSTFRSLKKQPPYEYNYSQYQTFLASLRLARIECLILDFFIRFSNGLDSKNLNLNGRESSGWANGITNRLFFTPGAVFIHSDTADAFKHNMHKWFEISYLIQVSQIERYSNTAISMTCISLQDIFKMLIPLFVFEKGLAPYHFKQTYLEQLGLSIGSTFTSTIIKNVKLDALFYNMSSRFGLVSRIKNKVQYLLGIHSEKGKDGAADKLRFSEKDTNAAHSETHYGTTRNKRLVKVHKMLDRTKRRLGRNNKEFQRIIDNECVGNNKKSYYRGIETACRANGYKKVGEINFIFRRVMSRVQVLLYQQYDIHVSEGNHANFDISKFNHAEIEKYVNHKEKGASNSDGRGSQSSNKDDIAADIATNRDKYREMDHIYQWYSYENRFDEKRRLFMMRFEKEFQEQIVRIIQMTMNKINADTYSNQNLYR